MALLISEVFVNSTEGYRFGETEPYVPFTDNTLELFRSLQHEYGRCVSRIYVDTKGRSPAPIGWVFQRRMKYEDTQESYTREVWVTLHDAPDDHRVERHYHVIGGK